MKQLFLSLAILLFTGFAVTSCSDDETMNNETPASRDYETDARILSKFVDVNKTIGEYYINENKKNSPLSYLTNKDWEELQSVNPANRARYENELKALNASLEAAAKSSDVIVYNTYGETWVRNIKENTPIEIEKQELTSTRNTRSSYGRMGLLYNSEQRQSFYAGNQIRTRIDINLMGYTYYFFDLICDTNATKSGSSSGGYDPKKVTMSGTTSMESWEYSWRENTGSNNVYWEFRGKRHAPSDFSSNITVEFFD